MQEEAIHNTKTLHCSMLMKKMRHIGIYILNGLCPSPQVEMKFYSQERNPTNGNDMCNWVFGTCAGRRHKEFEDFLAIQYPVKPVTLRNTHPNWKVQPIPKQAIIVSKAEIVLGKGLAKGEETICCKGRHPDILRITYKKIGGWLPVWCIVFIWLHVQLLLPKPDGKNCFIDKGMSSLHARCMALLEQVNSSAHYVGMYNIYISAKFIR